MAYRFEDCKVSLLSTFQPRQFGKYNKLQWN